MQRTVISGSFRWTQIATGIVCGVLLTGCGKDVDTFVPDPQGPQAEIIGDIDRFFDAARESIEYSLVLSTEQPSPVVTSRKSVFIFQPGAFTDETGADIHGTVEVRVKELLTKGEVLLYGIPTHSRNQLTVNGAEFHISAVQDNKSLFIKSNKPVRILTDLPQGEFPNARMELFYDVHESLPSGTEIPTTWTEADANPNTWSSVQITEWAAVTDQQQIVTGYGYVTFSDSMGWIGMQAFAGISPGERTNLCVQLPPGYATSNTAVFVVLNNMHSVVRLRAGGTSGTFCNANAEDYHISLPVAASVTLIAIAERGVGQYEMGKINTKLGPEHVEHLVPEPATVQEIKTVIAGL